MWTARELVAASGASTGATYRVLEYLEREDLVAKDDGRYWLADWERLLRAWSADAPFSATTRATTFIEPRGIDAFLIKVAGEPTLPAVVTGSVAAAQWATYAPAKAVFAQVAADLLNGPGREPTEGEHLIEWMVANEQRWRRG
ncbi:hypothetical protein CCO02nite_28840 [Cellulomonas composti]|uniref:HTH iclR-type domain-containing protein n=1 Tax=Cellulomonas composti TaxID=266130 RepID=A0A511JE63_9CELL|nr:hypothetical protein CCO02nite_28840 [Cellulomonas composti]